MRSWLRSRNATGPGPGGHGYAKRTVQQNQRTRLLAAAATLAARHGFAAITSRALAKEAGVSQTTLYELYGTKDDCSLAAAEETLEHLIALMGAAAASRQPAAERIDRIVETWMRFCATYPDAAQLALVELPGAGPVGIEMREAALQRILDLLREPIEEAYPHVPRLTPELTVGALVDLAGRYLRLWRADELPELGPALAAELLGGPSAREPGGR